MSGLLPVHGLPDLLLRVLDTGLTAGLFFALYLFFRGTKAVNMLAGLLVVFLLAFIARWLNLTTLAWLFDAFLRNIFIVLVIIFHPELRRMLLKFGRSEWLAVFRGRDRSGWPPLEKAVQALARESTGALFVLQRFTRLATIQETGVTLNAQSSVELLTAIFYGKNPLHDGAVLLHQDTVLAAGCFLPLAQTTDLPQLYGTRHRAALGASEEYDCLVVVVSEERGEVSLAFDGRLIPTTPTAFGSLARELMRPRRRPLPPSVPERDHAH